MGVSIEDGSLFWWSATSINSCHSIDNSGFWLAALGICITNPSLNRLASNLLWRLPILYLRHRRPYSSDSLPLKYKLLTCCSLSEWPGFDVEAIRQGISRAADMLSLNTCFFCRVFLSASDDLCNKITVADLIIRLLSWASAVQQLLQTTAGPARFDLLFDRGH